MFTISAVYLYDSANSVNDGDLDDLYSLISSNNIKINEQQQKITTLQSQVNLLLTERSNSNDYKIDVLEEAMSDIDYCARVYDGSSEFDDFADCVSKRIS